MKTGKCLGLFLAFLLPSLVVCSHETFKSPKMEALSSKLKTFIASSPQIKPAYNCSLVHLYQSPVADFLETFKKVLSAPFNPSSVHKKKPVYVLRTNCHISHYTMYSKEQQNTLLQACLEKKFYSIPLPANMSCEFLKTDSDKDTLFPEFIQMRKAFVDREVQFKSNETEYTAQTKACLASLLKGEPTGTTGLCYRLTDFLTRTYPTDDVAPDAREIFSQGVFLDLLRPRCANVDPKNVALKSLCDAYNKKRAFDCFVATIKNSFCRMVQHGSNYKGSSILRYYAHLHDLYNEVQEEYRFLEDRAVDCILKIKGTNCGGSLSRKDYASLNALKKQGKEFLENLIKAKNAGSTTTARPRPRPRPPHRIAYSN